MVAVVIGRLVGYGAAEVAVVVVVVVVVVAKKG